MLLNQVLVNLLDNALKFVPPDRTPHIRIFARQRDSRTQLCIQDNGIGIEPALQAKLFELFFRANNSRNYEGSGIGLAIVRNLVERHGGRVRAESEGLGHGSTFGFSIPRARASSDPHLPTAQRPTEDGGGLLDGGGGGALASGVPAAARYEA